MDGVRICDWFGNGEIINLGICAGADSKLVILDVDPRHWKPGKSYVLRERVTLPNDMPKGAYAVYLNLPDPYETLQSDPRYSFRIASKGVWDPETGFNKLTGGVTVEVPPIQL